MDTGLIFLVVLSLILTVAVALKDRARIVPSITGALSENWPMLIRVPVALLAATLVSELIPIETIAPLIGHESGWTGILLASVCGAFLPGGPALTFPIALVIWSKGAGEAQMIALLASWSIFAVHRVFAYELPFLGARFVALRLASSWMLPPVAGGIGLWLLYLK